MVATSHEYTAAGYSSVVRAWMLVLAITITVGEARGAPLADVVVAWRGGGQPLGPVGDTLAGAAGRAGASYIDASPVPAQLPDPRPLIKRGIGAYAQLELDQAASAFDAAVEIVDQTGAHGLDARTLGDLFLYRGLTSHHGRDDARAWDDLVIAATVDPTRVLDPASVAPSAIERFAQAKERVAAQPKSRVTLAGAAGCRVRIDGVVTTSTVIELVFGRHWLDAECEGRAAVRRRVQIDRPASELAVAGEPLAPPDDTALVIQARAASARAIVIVTVQGHIAVARRIGSDGKPQDRASVSTRDPSAVARMLSRLLVPPSPAPATPWYRTRWTWAAAGVVVASAILIPIAATRGGGAPADVVVAPTGQTPW